MPSYLSPGVYVEEVSSGSRPIEGVGTALSAFVGFTERGPLNEPILVTNWTQYTKNFGEFVDGAYLPHSVYGYFLNGGGSAYVVRVGGPTAPDGELPAGSEANQPHAAAELIARANSSPAYAVRAIAPGAAGNDLTIEISDASEPGEDTFKLVVKKAGKVEETFDNVTAKRGQANVVTAVRQRSKLITIEEVKTGSAAVPRKGAEVALAGGDLPAIPDVRAEDYVGDSAARTG